MKDKVESLTGPSSKGPSRSSRKKAGDDVAEQWYYSYGHVSPMKEEVDINRMYGCMYVCMYNMYV